MTYAYDISLVVAQVEKSQSRRVSQGGGNFPGKFVHRKIHCGNVFESIRVRKYLRKLLFFIFYVFCT